MAKEFWFNTIIDGEECTGVINTCRHSNLRAEERENLSNDFLAGRIATLMEQPNFADMVLNGIKIGDRFVVEDEAMGYSIIACHSLECGYDAVDIITMRRSLRIGDGQNVLRVLRDGIRHCIWHAASRVFEEVVY